MPGSGGGVGRSLISLTFLFTFKLAIRGVKPWSVSSIGASYRGPLVFSAITGGTQTQHWRGGGVGRSLISLTFLFTL